jgi:beta-ureidopropionase / N-carbamoyl-L-amino-acid hydrolase
MSAFTRMWANLADVGRDRATGGYRRFAWTREDAVLREWFAGEAARRGMAMTEDRAGNQWAWRGDPDLRPGIVVGSHLDSVPDGGAFDGPLGVVSGFLALDALPDQTDRPVGVVNFADEEGARFGVACAGSRLLTGALSADRARALRDDAGRSLAEAVAITGRRPEYLGRDAEALRRVGTFVELHVEQGRGLVHEDAPVGVASAIWPHGRWRLDFAGEANHAGTTALDDRRDPMLDYAEAVLRARTAARKNNALATFGKLSVTPNAVNAIPSQVRSWLDVRAPTAAQVEAVLAELGAPAMNESWTDETAFEGDLRERIVSALGHPPVLSTGAGHDAGILAAAGVPTAMIFVRNPTGVSHSPAEHADTADCERGVDALTRVIAELVRQ